MKIPWLPVLILFVPACLENEEELEVHPDGSVDVTLSSHGDLADLADGYPLPLQAPWRLASEDARRWTLAIGPETGSLETRKRAAEVAWPTEPGKEPQAQLAVKCRFGSVEELPRVFAPADEPYRSAHLTRDTSLTIDPKPQGRVFLFERTYHGFDRARLDPVGEHALPEEIEKKFMEKTPLTEGERGIVRAVVADGYERTAEALARDALLGVFTQGQSGLAPHALAALLDEVRSASRAVLTPKRLERLIDIVHAGGDASAEALQELEQEWRAALRQTLSAALKQHRVAPESGNAALYALEWQFTAFDHFGDLLDETFRVRLKLPGTVVTGNFDRLEDGIAHWKFEGKDLDGKDVVLRAVSVLE